MRVAVTGASGFIGSHLVPHLRGLGHEVLPLSGRELATKLSGVEAVVHLAARTGDHPEEVFYAANVELTEAWLARAARVGVSRFVLASTRAVYSPEYNLVPFTERQRCRPRTLYGRSKLLAERAVRRAAKEVGGICLRLAQVLGPGMPEAGMIPRMWARARGGLPPVVWGSGQGARDYVWIEDVVAAFANALTTDCGGVFNVASGVAVTHAEAATTLMRAYGLTGEPERRPGQPADEGVWLLSRERAEEELWWRPTVGFREMMGMLRQVGGQGRRSPTSSETQPASPSRPAPHSSTSI